VSILNHLGKNTSGKIDAGAAAGPVMNLINAFAASALCVFVATPAEKLM
jgi:hypothetical protein